jgi:hypothetical protein
VLPGGGAAAADPPPEPFAWGDFTWLNGSSRQTTRLLDTKYFTPQLDVDVNYTYSFNHPIDHTVVGSTALARDNEVEIAFIGLGGDVHAGNVRARLLLQYGTRTTVVPRNDGSVLRGQFDLATAYRFISEGYVGYHLDWLHGVNVDAGIFMSYVGLFSYDNFEMGLPAVVHVRQHAVVLQRRAHSAVPDRSLQGRAVDRQRLAVLRQIQRAARRRLPGALRAARMAQPRLQRLRRHRRARSSGPRSLP